VAQIRAVQEEFHNVTADQAAGESIGFLNPTLYAVGPEFIRRLANG
jgi:hypothetical protein